MPSALARYLLPSEICVAIVRRHWAVLLPQGSVIAATWIAWALVLDASVSSFVQTIAAFFYLFSGAWFGWLLGEYYTEQFVVTNKRILLISGLLYQKLAVMPLTKVTDLTYQRSPMGRLLGYGTFILESAGQDQALSRVDYLRSPDRLYQRLSQEIFGPGRAGQDTVAKALGITVPGADHRPDPPGPPGPPAAPSPPGTPQPPAGLDPNELARQTSRLPRLPWAP